MVIVAMGAVLAVWMYYWIKLGPHFLRNRQSPRYDVNPRDCSQSLSGSPTSQSELRDKEEAEPTAVRGFEPARIGKSWCNVRRNFGEYRRLVKQEDGSIAEFTLLNGVPRRLVTVHSEWKDALYSVK